MVISQNVKFLIIVHPSGHSVYILAELWVRFPTHVPCLGSVAVTVSEIQTVLGQKLRKKKKQKKSSQIQKG